MEGFLLVKISVNRRIIAFNSAFDTVQRSGKFFSNRDNHLFGCHQASEDFLSSMISHANDHGFRAPLRADLTNDGTLGKDWISVSRRLMGFGGDGGLVLLTFRAMNESEPMNVRETMSILGLTSAEARLALQLAAGSTLDEIADRNGLQVSTLRAQLRSVYSKTGINRQFELVARIWRASGL
jgi:DNA-binding CsgD family transcriptional regulator